MNSKTRVMTALNGDVPDRVPIGEFAVDFDTVEKILGHETYLRAKAKSQFAFWENRHDEVADSYLNDHIELCEKLDLDIVTFPAATWSIPPETDEPPRKIADNTWEDKYGRVFKFSPITHDITCVHDPVTPGSGSSLGQILEDLPAEAHRRKIPQVSPPTFRSWEILDTVIQRFKDEKFICGPSGGEIGILLLGGVEEGLFKLVQDPERVKAAAAFLLKQQNLADELMIHPDQDGVLWGQDFSMATGPFISPMMFRALFLEPNKGRVMHLHQKGLKVLKHCCGNNWSMLDAFIEIGYDCYQSIDQTAGEDICALKKSYGDKMPLWGGVDVAHLINGTMAEVREDVRRAMDCAKPRGGFILGSSHSIAVGTNYDNYMAMLDAYHKLASY